MLTVVDVSLSAMMILHLPQNVGLDLLSIACRVDCLCSGLAPKLSVSWQEARRHSVQLRILLKKWAAFSSFYAAVKYDSFYTDFEPSQICVISVYANFIKKSCCVPAKHVQ